MADAEATLARGETAPADFTLHDEMHGFRVAERMADLIGVNRLHEFSPTELALLLASAYLHDIGMTPKKGHIRRHRDYLISGDVGQLAQEQRDELQTWLDDHAQDDHAEGVTPPLATGIPDSATLARVDELLTYYCRFRHNDWSAEWIRENVATADRELYFGFSDDLIQLCRSHHEGYEELIGARFDAKLIGADIVHPRYLAALLRIADIIEFDPERTPEIIFRHREVAPSSTIYWYKDHEVSFRTEDDYFIFYARPRDAATFQALRQMANEIDNELAVCSRLNKEGRFQLAPLRTGNDPRYVWRFEPILKRDVHPKPETFEEFDGAFQPNPRRLLSLLADTQLYETPMAAVRELLQNAFDAVREQIAYERLAEIDRFGTADGNRIASRHFVTLDIRTVEDQWELVCTDSGVGMTRDILRRRFLTSGSGRGHREFDLERRCRAHDFSVGRTGEFGIGALSYFMIADQIELVTCRSSEPGDADGAWRFRVSGLNDFGELRHAQATQHGTTVRLRLKPKTVHGSIQTLTEELNRYLAFVLCRVPCRFVARDINDVVLMKIEPGWAKTARDLALDVYPTLEPSRRWGWSADSALSTPFPQREDVWFRLRWNVDEGDLPNDVGRFRIHLFWFKLDGGASRAWFESRRAPALEIREQRLSLTANAVDVSWNGIALNDSALQNHHSLEGAALEIDFEGSAAGKVAVNRTSVTLSENGNKAQQWVENRLEQLESEWLRKNTSSPFWAHALRFSSANTDLRVSSQWAFRSTKESVYCIRPVAFPVVSATRRPVRLNGIEIDSLEPYPDSEGTEWENRRVRPHRIVVKKGNRLDQVLVWDDDSNTEPLIALPPSWLDVIVVETESDYLFSATHPLVAAAREDLLNRLHTLKDFRTAEELLKETHFRPVVRLLALFTTWGRTDAWQSMENTERVVLWDAATTGVPEQPSRLVVVDQDDRHIEIYTRDGVTTIAYLELTHKDLDDLLPDPGVEWQYEQF
ncbi:MAG: hypothetical protein WB973_07820 [Thermoanaerobaculia bacterium]